MNNQKQRPSNIMNATIVTGTYINRDNIEKKNYLTIGTLFMYPDGGMSLKLDALPTNGQNITFYPRKAKEHNQPMQQNHQHHENNHSQYPQHNQNQHQGSNQNSYPQQETTVVNLNQHTPTQGGN